MFAKFSNTSLILLLSLSYIGNSYGMSYHDNEVSFKSIISGQLITGGHFTVNEFFVTNGQDPKNKIYNGLSVTLDDGAFSFQVGRKGSDETANWFKQRISDNQNTFGHAPGKLNFAFIGTLSLDFRADALGYSNPPYKFSNIAIAQGHAGASNNWWFGGKNCKKTDGKEVRCQGIDSRGKKVEFLFQRGGNNVHTIDVLVDAANWMSFIDGRKKINNLMMPGSHDAGMSETNHCTKLLPAASGLVKTQSLDMGGQLLAGSRYFDIRVDYDHGELVTYHRTDIDIKVMEEKGVGCNGQNLDSILSQAVSFLQAHNKETLILNFGHIRSDRGDEADIKKRINDLLSSKYQKYLYTNGSNEINLAHISLGDARGKMIAVFNYNDYLNTANGRFRYRDGFVNGVCSYQGMNLTVCDSYADTDNYNKMSKDQINKWENYAGLNKDYLFLLSWTLTAKAGCSIAGTLSSTYCSIEGLASIANSRLPGVLFAQIAQNGKSKPNIIFIDFINEETTQSIIQYNFMEKVTLQSALDTQKCLDVSDAKTANGTNIQLYDCNGTNAQKWIWNGSTLYSALDSRKCLDVSDAKTANGTNIQLYDCNGTNSQKWTQNSSTFYSALDSRKCLDVFDAKTANGTNIQLYDCNGTNAQKWNFVLQ